ncbi:MAG: hypothetical protein ABI354_03270 [Candidatus Saccharimonadales bacterium]
MLQGNQSEQLFTALAEQFKLPLLQIARLAENNSQDNLLAITTLSNQALRLIDGFIRVQSQDQTSLQLEPLTTNSVLYDVANTLQPLARSYDVLIDVDHQGKNTPVMAHRESLQAILTLLGASLIEASNDESGAPASIILGTHSSAKGVVVGAFSKHTVLTQRMLLMARELHGRATQSTPYLGGAGGAGLAIADYLSNQMEAPIKSYRHRSMTGLGSLLTPTRQLQLV